MGKILQISLKLNFSPNTLGCYGLTKRISPAYEAVLIPGFGMSNINMCETYKLDMSLFTIKSDRTESLGMRVSLDMVIDILKLMFVTRSHLETPSPFDHAFFNTLTSTVMHTSPFPRSVT